MAINCFRYLGFTSYKEVDCLTIPQYVIMMKAARLRQFDLDYRIHLQAFLNFAATAKKKNGQPVYKRFRKFFDFEKHEARARGVQKRRLKGLENILRKEVDDGEGI